MRLVSLRSVRRLTMMMLAAVSLATTFMATAAGSDATTGVAATTKVAGDAIAIGDQASPGANAATADAAAPPTSAPASGQPLTQEDVAGWLDGFMPYALKQGDIAGAVVVVVKGGQVLAQKGYGYADVAAGKPVDPLRTLFRPGSISKLFTFTAAMQMVEQGKLDLDADINTYLDFKIPPRDGKPVTLRNLLTHTAGFEEQIKRIMGTEATGIPALGEHLKDWTPQRIFAPGVTPAYSNYGAALAGYLVERVSGLPFADYVDQHILTPLDMKSSSMHQPLPERLQADMSKGYRTASDGKAQPYEITGPAPAGSLATTGADMANFMIAHLQNGRFGEAQILEPRTANLMHGTPLTILPRVDRMLLGFYEVNLNGRRVISHGGDTNWFHSDLYLFIDDGVGLFISMNSAGFGPAVSAIRAQLFEQFADRYLPGSAADLTSADPAIADRAGVEGKVDAATAAQHARMIAGSYDGSRRSESNFLDVASLMPLHVMANEDGTISLSMITSASGVPVKWREIEPFVWRKVNGKGLLAAQVQGDQVVRLSFDGVSPIIMFDRTPAWRKIAAVTWVLGLAAALLTALAWPVAVLTRRHFAVPYQLAGRDAWAHRSVRLGALALLVAAGLWLFTFTRMLADTSLLTPSSDGRLLLLQGWSLLACVGAAAAAVWHAWRTLRARRRWYVKAWALLLAVAFLGLLWFGYAFNLITLNVNY